MNRTAAAITLAAACLAAIAFAPPASAAETRLASPNYTKTLFTRFNVVRNTNESGVAAATFAASDYRNVSPLALSVTCPLTSCGLGVDVDMSVSATVVNPTDSDSIFLCVYVDNVRKDCSWNAVGQRVTGARLGTFVPLAKGVHAIQVKGKSYTMSWSLFEATAHYTLLGP